MTTQAQQAKAQSIADEASKLPGVASAVVDDWDDHGGFSIFIQLKNKLQNSFCGRSTRIEFEISLRGLIQRMKAISEKAGAYWEWHEPPKRIYSYAGPCAKKFWDGYDRDSYKVSFRIG
jgi:hypothetical protein